MNIEEYRRYCLGKPGVSEGFPFDESTLVFKVQGKMFALTDIDLFDGINLKCDPELALSLREKHDGVRPGYHMNKTHWNTVSTKGDIDDVLILELTDHSYDLVVKSLPRKLRDDLQVG